MGITICGLVVPQFDSSQFLVSRATDTGSSTKNFSPKAIHSLAFIPPDFMG
jgi:hypothetical protein